MTDKRRHRGPHPADPDLFGDTQLPTLQQAVAELSWLLSRGYGDTAALKLVGDRHGLTARQRAAVQRAACADAARRARRASRQPLAAIRGRPLYLDGYNVLTSVEAGLAGGLLMRCRDGCVRDIASMHGSFRKVAETEPAAIEIGRTLNKHKPSEVVWLLDQPVSNSGRLSQLLRQIATNQNWPWRVEVVASPDAELRAATALIASADSAVLDAGPFHVDLAGAAVEQWSNQPWLIDLNASVKEAPPADKRGRIN